MPIDINKPKEKTQFQFLESNEILFWRLVFNTFSNRTYSSNKSLLTYHRHLVFEQIFGMCALTNTHNLTTPFVIRICQEKNKNKRKKDKNNTHTKNTTVHKWRKLLWRISMCAQQMIWIMESIFGLSNIYCSIIDIWNCTNPMLCEK